MRLLTQTMPDDFDLVILGDDHEGARAQYTKGLDKVIKWIGAKPNRFFVQMGDEIEARCIDHPYYDPKTSKMATPLEQIQVVEDRYGPIADRCVAWLYGNHPASLSRFGNLTEMLCGNLGIPYGTTTAIVQFNDSKGKQIFKGFFWHPFRLVVNSSAQDYEHQLNQMRLKIKRAMREKASDCLLMVCGHIHKLLLVPPAEKLIMRSGADGLKQAYLKQGDGRADYIEPDRRWYGSSGSFLKTYLEGADTYSEKAGYNPVEIGYLVAHVKDREFVGMDRVVI